MIFTQTLQNQKKTKHLSFTKKVIGGGDRESLISDYLKFAKQNQTKEYYRIFKGVVDNSGSNSELTVESIANNDKMKMVEKFTLLLAFPTFMNVEKNL